MVPHSPTCAFSVLPGVDFQQARGSVRVLSLLFLWSKWRDLNLQPPVIQAAIAGHGVALGRTTLVARDLAEGRLVRPFGEAQPYAYYMVYKKENHVKPALVAFEEWLLSEADLGR